MNHPLILPKYGLLVEKLTARILLKVVCGADPLIATSRSAPNSWPNLELF